MAIGINGMGRIGRLTLRAAMGGAWRDQKDPFRNNRLEIAHVNEISGDSKQSRIFWNLTVCKAAGVPISRQMATARYLSTEGR